MLNCRKILKSKANLLNFKQLVVGIIYACVYNKHLIINMLRYICSFWCNSQGEASARRASVLPCEYWLQGFHNFDLKVVGIRRVEWSTDYADRPRR